MEESDILRIIQRLAPYGRQDKDLFVRIFHILHEDDPNRRFKITKNGLVTKIENLSKSTIEKIAKEVDRYQQFSNRVIMDPNLGKKSKDDYVENTRS